MSDEKDSGETNASNGGRPGGSRFTVVRRLPGFSGRSVLEPLLIIVIGLAIGLVDLTSAEAPGMLRIPALIAGLILVGQGLNLLEDARNARLVEEAVHDRQPAVVGEPATALVPGPGGGVQQVVIAGGPAEEIVETRRRRTPSRAYLVLALAIWLGLATLAFPTAPMPLVLLSLLSAYLLFARGWRSMQVSDPA